MEKLEKLEKQTNPKRLSLGRMLAFASGDIFGGGSFNIINFLYPGFLAFAVGLSAHTAGIVMLIARIFDAVIDPAIGFVSDRLRVRFGTRRSSVIVAAPFLVLSMFLMFFPYSNPNETVRFWAVMLSYMFFALSQSVVMISYHSLSTEITEDYTERARMTSLRLGFSIFSSIVCVAVPGMIVNAFEGNTGYIVMSLSFGFVFMVSVGITGFLAKEDVPAPKESEPFAVANFFRPFLVKPFRQYLYIYLCCQATMAVMSALFFFYIDFYFCRDLTAGGEGNVVGLLGAALMFGMQIVALPVYLAMIKRTNKTTVYILGSAIWIVGALFLGIIPANSNPALIYVLAAVLGFGISGPGLIPHAIFGDVVDVGSLQFGTPAAGAFGGIANFCNQVAQALGVGVVMMIIGAAGFVEQDIAALEPVVSQPESAQGAIIYIMMFAPLVFLSLGIFVCTRYRLNKEKHAEVLAATQSGDENTRTEVLKSL